MGRRSYKQFCATARTLDLVGERWTLLIVRELLTGPKRFRDLLDAMQGMGTGLLAGRLKFLEAEGLVERTTLPPPARTPAYALTEAGAELEPVVMALARWGLRWALDERREGEEFRPGWAVLGMQAIFDPEAARGVRGVCEFRVDDDLFYARIDDGEIETGHGPAHRPDVVIETSNDTYLELASGRLTLPDALRRSSTVVSGDRRLLQKLLRVFRWPDQRTRTTGAA